MPIVALETMTQRAPSAVFFRDIDSLSFDARVQ